MAYLILLFYILLATGKATYYCCYYVMAMTSYNHNISPRLEVHCIYMSGWIEVCFDGLAADNVDTTSRGVNRGSVVQSEIRT